MTHRAQTILEKLGLWQKLPADELAPLREAVVYNGSDTRPLRFDAKRSAEDELGHLLSNHVIRRVTWEAARERGLVTIKPGHRVTGFETTPEAATLRCRDAAGAEVVLRAPLVVAADSRFSELRRKAGIGAQMRDFGRSVIVGRMTHEVPHGGIAQECFVANHTVAVLPMNGNVSSIVVTQPSDIAQQMMGWTDAAYEAWAAEQLHGRLGTLKTAGPRTLYPLVAVYAHRFVGHRFALVGDAAVGMHPVTAHGYNFGLYGAERLTGLLATARAEGRDLGEATVLEPYESGHRLDTFAIYHGTNVVVGLFTDERRWARPLRQAVLRVADALPPLKVAITSRLTSRAAPRMPKLPDLPPLPKIPKPPLPPLPPGLAQWFGRG